MKLSSLSYKIIWASSLITVLVLYNICVTPRRSALQLRFDGWLTSRPAAVVSLRGSLAGEPLEWRLDAKESSRRADQVLRVLELVRESNIFSKSARPVSELTDAKAREGLLLEASDERERFSAQITPALIAKTPALQIMMKLVDIYSREPQPQQAHTVDQPTELLETPIELDQRDSTALD